MFIPEKGRPSYFESRQRADLPELHVRRDRRVSAGDVLQVPAGARVGHLRGEVDVLADGHWRPNNTPRLSQPASSQICGAHMVLDEFEHHCDTRPPRLSLGEQGCDAGSLRGVSYFFSRKPHGNRAGPRARARPRYGCQGLRTSTSCDRLRHCRDGENPGHDRALREEIRLR